MHFTQELFNVHTSPFPFRVLQLLLLRIIYSNSLTVLQARRKAAWRNAPLEGQERQNFGTARLGSSLEHSQ